MMHIKILVNRYFRNFRWLAVFPFICLAQNSYAKLTGIKAHTGLCPTITVSASKQVNEHCVGDSNALAVVSASGGTSPYTYTWSPGGYTTDSAGGLAAGVYTVTATDFNGCTGTLIITITNPPLLKDSISASANITCNGYCNGSATLGITGGTKPYSLKWNTGANYSPATGLCSGKYYCVVTDSNGCISESDTAYISQPPLLTITSSSTVKATCGQSNGSASVTVSGGVVPYSYNWFPMGTIQDTATGLAAGTYTCLVLDSNGCDAVQTVVVADSTNMNAIINAPPFRVTCGGSCDGKAGATQTGGTGPFTYSWSTGETADSITDVCAGLLILTVTDSKGCSAVDTATYVQATLISASPAMTPDAGSCDGTAMASVSGGIAPYFYSWSPGGATTDTIKGLCGGKYCCKVTDVAGCTDSVCIIVAVVTGIGNTSASPELTLFPVPASNTLTIATGNATTLKGTLTVYDITGRHVLEQNNLQFTSEITINTSALPDGVYLVKLQTISGTLNGKFMIAK